MRIILFFDLPTETMENRRDYTHFRKFLIKSGFIMLQESVYCKLALNHNMVESVMNNIKKNKPVKGLIQALVVTEKQYTKMEYILGESSSDIVSTDERFIEL